MPKAAIETFIWRKRIGARQLPYATLGYTVINDCRTVYPTLRKHFRKHWLSFYPALSWKHAWYISIISLFSQTRWKNIFVTLQKFCTFWQVLMYDLSHQSVSSPQYVCIPWTRSKAWNVWNRELCGQIVEGGFTFAQKTRAILFSWVV